ncbi:MAG: 50S ribosomal protein L20 [Deltaproteobacteria bacterium]|nr:MAG: 50S ribosomal protein L20 [Deltaproteobacteria bacterium]
MVRVTSGYKTHKRHKRTIKMVSGYQGTRNRLYRTAIESLEKALVYNYRDRKAKKRYFRRLWIIRINAAVRKYGFSYSKFMLRLKEKGLLLNRQVLSNLVMGNCDIVKSLVS